MGGFRPSELALGHLHQALTDIPPQPNPSPTAVPEWVVFAPGQVLGTKPRGLLVLTPSPHQVSEKMMRAAVFHHQPGCWQVGPPLTVCVCTENQAGASFRCSIPRL